MRLLTCVYGVLSYLASDQVEEESTGLKAVMQVEAKARLKGNSLFSSVTKCCIWLLNKYLQME